MLTIGVGPAIRRGMSNNIKLEVGKKYLTRDGRVAEITGEDFTSCASSVARWDGRIGDRAHCWRYDGQYLRGEESDHDLVSEYVETPSAPVAYRYFTAEGSDRSHEFFCIWRAPDCEPDRVEALCPNRPADTWDPTGYTFEELSDSDGEFVECDENGVPLSPTPTPEPRIPEGFIEVTRTYPSFTPEARAAVLIRVSDIVLVHSCAEGCTIGTTSGHLDYPVSESYTTVLEKINAALP